MFYVSRADIEQCNLDVFKIGPPGLKENIHDGERLVRLLRDFFSKFRVAKIETRPNQEYPSCSCRKEFCRCRGSGLIKERVHRCSHVRVGSCPQASIYEPIAIVMIAV